MNKKIILIGLILVLSSYGYAWWDTDWSYKQPITISEQSGSALTDYQVKLSIDTTSLYNAGKLRSDCGDLRFINGSENTELSYWIEECSTSGENSTVWVKIPYISASGTETVYMYYGNSGATSESNGDNTFIYWDDYSSDPSITDGKPSGVNNYVEYDSTNHNLYWYCRRGGKGAGVINNPPGGHEGKISLPDDIQVGSDNFIFRFKYRQTTWSDAAYSDHARFVVKNLTSEKRFGFDTATDSRNSASPAVQFWASDGTNYYTGSWYTISVGTTYLIESSSNGHFKVFNSDGTTLLYAENVSVSNMNGGYDKLTQRSGWSYSSTSPVDIGWYDDALIRKYTDPEPTTSFGAEEGQEDIEFTLTVYGQSGVTANTTGVATAELEFNISSSTQSNIPACVKGGYCQGSGGTDWWNTDWSYKQPITISEQSGSALTDYQVKLSIDTTSLYNAGKLRSDCGDLRFINGSENTELSYWIEECSTSGENSTVWVKIPYISASGTETVYMYYGNSGATSNSNGDNTFIYFEDFSSDPEFSSGYTMYHNIEIRYKNVSSPLSYSDNWTMEFRKTVTSITSPPSAYGPDIRIGFGNSNGWYSGSYLIWNFTGYNIYPDSDNTYYEGDVYINDAGGVDANQTFTSTVNDEEKIKIIKSGNTINLSEFDPSLENDAIVQQDTGDTWSFNAFEIMGYRNDGEGSVSFGYDSVNENYWIYALRTSGTPDTHVNITIDDIRIAKYTDPEPSASFGAEEEQSSGSAIFFFNNTGTETLSMNLSLNASLPSSMTLKGDIDSDPTGASTITTSGWIMDSSFTPGETHNVWLWLDCTNCAVADSTTRKLKAGGTT